MAEGGVVRGWRWVFREEIAYLRYLNNMAVNLNLTLEQDVKALYQSLSGHLLPKSREVNAHIRGFLEEEIRGRRGGS
jgi:hypothetical protein